MLRRLFTLLSAVSLVLCVATCVLWVRSRSHGVSDAVAFQEGGVRWRVVSDRGGVRVDNRPQVEADRAKVDRRVADIQARQSDILDRGEAIIDAAGRLSAASHAWQEAMNGLPQQLPWLPGSDEWLLRLTSDITTGASALSRDVRGRLGAESKADILKMRALRIERERLVKARPGPSADIVRADVRHGWLVAASAVLPAGWLVGAAAARFRRRRRQASNCCPSCGYDLRATPGRCPECGKVPVAGPDGAGGPPL